MQFSKRGSHIPWVSQGRFQKRGDMDPIFQRGIQVGQMYSRLQAKTLLRKQQGKRQRGVRKWGVLGELTSSCVGSVWVKQY